MVKKIIACGDIHIRNLRRMEETYDMLSKFIDECGQYKIDNNLLDDELRIVVAGDIFENKINVSNEANLAASWFLNSLSEISPVIVICGNHDYLANNLSRVDSITPIVSIANNERIVYLDSQLEFQSGIYVDDNIAWVLFSTFDGFTRPNEIGTVEGNVTYVGLIHADVNGAVSDTNRVTENGLDPTIFDGCDFVIAGHIHKHQEIKKNGVKTVYCSSLIQQNNGESIHGHGFVVWDVEECDYEFIELENENYGFYKFAVNDIEDIENDKETLINL
jgi:DNA repair exonuclease SbcCD nuclease subunit